VERWLSDSLSPSASSRRRRPSPPRASPRSRASVSGRGHARIPTSKGPVHTEEVARRIREGFGLQKTGSRIVKHVRNALLAQARIGTIRREEDFWTIPGRGIENIRTRRTAALPLRRANMIAPGKYHVAMLRIVEEAVTISRGDLAVETARRFGFDRTGPDLKEEINRQMSVLLKAGRISLDGSMVRAQIKSG
jgi:hypothetical protein